MEILINISVPKWNIEAFNGYKPITSFWTDFSIADRFGVKGIKETFNNIFEEWKDNYKYLTELVLVLNHKIWQWYEKNEQLAKLYNELWQKADSYACENLKGGGNGIFLYDNRLKRHEQINYIIRRKVTQRNCFLCVP